MRKSIKDFVSLVASSLTIYEPIYEFGSYQVYRQEGFANLRPLFPQKKYIGCDIREGLGVDKILDLHNIDLPSESVGTILCLDTLEHVEYPHKALKEIHRILKSDGIAVISSAMNFPIHDEPCDYWRFTPAAFTSLLKPFSDSFIGFVGIKSFPHTIVGIGFKGARPSITKFRNKYEIWRNKQSRTLEHIAVDVTPPILIPILLKVYYVLNNNR